MLYSAPTSSEMTHGTEYFRISLPSLSPARSFCVSRIRTSEKKNAQILFGLTHLMLHNGPYFITFFQKNQRTFFTNFNRKTDPGIRKPPKFQTAPHFSHAFFTKKCYHDRVEKLPRGRPADMRRQLYILFFKRRPPLRILCRIFLP